jgi:hypothetical protein
VGVGVFGRNHARVYQELEQQGEPVRLVLILTALMPWRARSAVGLLVQSSRC